MEWIKLSDTFPNEGTWVLAFSSKTGRHIAWYANGGFTDRADYPVLSVTKWMYIPD